MFSSSHFGWLIHLTENRHIMHWCSHDWEIASHIKTSTHNILHRNEWNIEWMNHRIKSIAIAPEMIVWFFYVICYGKLTSAAPGAVGLASSFSDHFQYCCTEEDRRKSKNKILLLLARILGTNNSLIIWAHFYCACKMWRGHKGNISEEYCTVLSPERLVQNINLLISIMLILCCFFLHYLLLTFRWSLGIDTNAFDICEFALWRGSFYVAVTVATISLWCHCWQYSAVVFQSGSTNQCWFNFA